jgi:ABC-type phosphate transport system permease subunit
MDAIPFEAKVLAVVVSVGYAAIQAFYPNMSKFLQQNFGLTNSQAGHYSSIPYIVASVTVPVIGHVLAYFGESYYEKFCKYSF